MVMPSMERVRGVGTFATTYNWVIEVASAPNAVPGLNEGLNVRAISTSIPTSSIEPIEINIRGHKIRQPGIETPQGTWELNLVDTEDTYISNLIYQWRQACYNTETGAQSSKEDVEAVLLIHRYDRNRSQIIWTYKVVGAWLTEYTKPELSGESEAFLPSITLSYDYIKEGAGSEVT